MSLNNLGSVQTAPAAHTNAELSPLLRLSGELRNRIYKYARETKAWEFFSLGRTCRQLRSEYLPIYLAITIFRVGIVDVVLADATEDVTVDLLPLLTFCARVNEDVKRLYIRFPYRRSIGGSEKNFEALCNVVHPKRWKCFFDEWVTGFEVDIEDPFFVFPRMTLKSAYIKPPHYTCRLIEGFDACMLLDLPCGPRENWIYIRKILVR
ncbi:hypothetical protein EK21DRAFT_112792 [Setomelanomma holmii]|uniref:Uncharacterized protein n=1 Tax=Setomelanomma holmii TaxID=210430 RepID=A0A9P4LMD8_9PLEO|nr:hypothetical protein EK21DRAFT_112792 [Setomelanomma holmii]